MMTVAGSDCSAGAGLQADMKAAHAMGAFALTAVTCVVSEVPGLVRGIQEVDPELVADQVRINLEHFPVSAVKTGMLYSPAIVRAVHEVLAGTGIPVVVDPVMIATAGDRLMREEAVAVYEELLLPGAALLTPIWMKPPCCCALLSTLKGMNCRRLPRALPLGTGAPSC